MHLKFCCQFYFSASLGHIHNEPNANKQLNSYFPDMSWNEEDHALYSFPQHLMQCVLLGERRQPAKGGKANGTVIWARTPTSLRNPLANSKAFPRTHCDVHKWDIQKLRDVKTAWFLLSSLCKFNVLLFLSGQLGEKHQSRGRSGSLSK